MSGIGLVSVIWAIISPLANGQMPVQTLDTSPRAEHDWLGETSECQPKNFIPGTTRYRKHNNKRWPKGYVYELEDNDGNAISGVAFKKYKVPLPAPYTLTVYKFGCMSQDDNVLEVKKGGRPFALYQHVDDFVVKESSSATIFLSNSRRLPDGRYEGFCGLVDVPSKRETPFPRLPCLDGQNRVRTSLGRDFVAYASTSSNVSATEICVWDWSGRLQVRLQAPLLWGDCGANSCSLLDKIGILPKEPGTLFIHSAFGATSRQQCQIALINLATSEMKLLGPLVVSRGTSPAYLEGGHGYTNRCGPPAIHIEGLTWDVAN